MPVLQGSHPEPARDLKEEDWGNDIFCNACYRFKPLIGLLRPGHWEHLWRNSIPKRNAERRLHFPEDVNDLRSGDKVQKGAEGNKRKQRVHYSSLVYYKEAHVRRESVTVPLPHPSLLWTVKHSLHHSYSSVTSIISLSVSSWPLWWWSEMPWSWPTFFNGSDTSV